MTTVISPGSLPSLSRLYGQPWAKTHLSFITYSVSLCLSLSPRKMGIIIKLHIDLGELNKVIRVKCLEEGLGYNKYSVSAGDQRRNHKW